MADKNTSCWKVVSCEKAQDCPDKCEPGKSCWEVSFLHNNWEKVFEKCKDCQVFHSTKKSSCNLNRS